MPKLLRSALSGMMSEAEMTSLYSSFDIVGDIAVLKIPPALADHSKAIADIVLQRLHHVKTVLNQKSPVQGQYRLRTLTWLAGMRKTETMSREANCIFKVDLARAYFSPRLAFERMRVSRLVESDEVVVNMFSGIGSFSIQIAMHSSPSIVFSIDINPDAVCLMRENIILNNLERKVRVIEGDARDVIETALIGKADRVIMPLPEKALQYLEAAVKALKPSGGTIHYYDFVHCSKRDDPCSEVRQKVEDKLSQFAKEYSVQFSRIVRSVGPNWYQVVLDIDAIPVSSSRASALPSGIQNRNHTLLSDGTE